MGGTKNQMNRFAKVDQSSYRQDGHPYSVTSCGRRRPFMHKNNSSGINPLKFKGANSSNSSCWPGYKKVGTKPSPSGTGETVNDCKKK